MRPEGGRPQGRRARVPWGTLSYAAAVQLGAYRMRRLPAVRREALLRAHSTNLANLRAGRWPTLLTSAFLLEEPMSPALAAVFTAVLGGAETAWGARRTAAVFGLGHIGASLLVYGGLRATRATSAQTAHAVDVGVSYGLSAVLGAGAASRRLRPPARAAGCAALLAVWARPLARPGRTFTDAGHLAALTLGMTTGLNRFRRCR